MRVDPTAFDVYYFAPQKCFASDGGLWLALVLAAPRSSASSASQRRRAGCRATLDLVDRGRELPPRPDVQHARARHALPARPAARSGCSSNGGLEFAAGRCDRSAGDRLRLGRRPHVRDAVREGSRAPQPRSPRRSTSTSAVDAAALAAALRANGIVDVEPYRKLGRNQLRIALFPAIEPDDVATPDPRNRLPAGAHGRSDRMLLLHEVHTVAGRHEDEFEDAFRNGWMTALAERRRRPPALLPEARARHRTRVPPHARSPRSRDGAAYERLARRMQTGDLRSWAADVDGMRHEVKGKLLLPVDWSPMQDDRPRDGADRRPRARARALHGRQRVAVRGEARHVPREGAHALRAEPRAALRALAAHVARGVPGRARRAPPARGRCCGSASTSPSGCPGLFTRELPAT